MKQNETFLGQNRPVTVDFSYLLSLKKKDWPKLVKVMARMECGVDLEDETIAKGWQLFRKVQS